MKWNLPSNDDGQRWPLWVGFSVTSAILIVSYGLRLGTLVGASPAELHTINELHSLDAIGHDLMLAPYKLLAWLFLLLPGSDLLNVRMTSVFMALVCIGLFYGLARRWHGRLVGAAAGVLFALSGWSLSTGRHGAGLIMLTLSVLALLSTAVLINKAKDSEHADKAVIAFGIATAIALMTPGGIWFAIATVAVVGKQLLGHAKLAGNTARIAAGAIITVGLGILIASCVSGVDQLHQALAIPASFPGIVVLLKQLALSVTGFIVRGPDMPSLWLAHTPLLDAAAATLLLLGAILYGQHISNSRTRLLLTFAGVGALLTMLNGALGLSYLLPVVYLIIASGLAYFQHQWRKVFPRNPVAETVSLIALGAVLLVAVGFHIQRYFVAWRHSPVTAQAYKQDGEAAVKDVPYLVQ